MFRNQTGLPRSASFAIWNSMSGAVPGRTITKRKMVTLRQPGTEKTAAAPQKVLQPISRNKSHHIPYLQAWRKQLRMSSSPGLRFSNSARPSQVSPMTDFRPMAESPRIQWRYRPGFSPGSLFSYEPVTEPISTHTNIHFFIGYHHFREKSSEYHEITCCCGIIWNERK